MDLDGPPVKPVPAESLIDRLTTSVGIAERTDGVTISNLHICDNAGWRRLDVGIPVTFEGCTFLDDVDFSNASLRSLTFDNCSVAPPSAGLRITRATILEDLLITECTFGWIDASLMTVSGDVTITKVSIGSEACPASVAEQRQASLDLRRSTLEILSISEVVTSDRVALFELEANEVDIAACEFGAARRNTHVINPVTTLDNSSVTSFATLWLSQVVTRNGMKLGPELTVHGDVRLVDARVGTSLRIGVSTDWAARTGASSLRTRATTIEGGVLNLLRARVGSRTEIAVAATDASSSAAQQPLAPPIMLNDSSLGDVSIYNVNSHPESGLICLNGASYSRLSVHADTTVAPTKSRPHGLRELDLVRRYAGARVPAEDGEEPATLYLGQPYRELAQSMARHGRTGDARTILMCMKSDERRFTPMSAPRRAWNWVSGVMIGHGYALHRTVVPLLLCVVLAFMVVLMGKATESFLATSPSIAAENILASEPVGGPPGETALARERAALQPSECTPIYPCLQPFVYTLDVLIPVFDFNQTTYWQPKQDWWGRAVLVALTVAAWILATLLIAGLSSAGRRDHDYE